MTLEQKLKRAFNEIRKQGIVARRNVMSCCQGCADLGIADGVPNIWSFGGQNSGNVITNDSYEYSPWGFNHDGLVTEDDTLTDAGRRVLEAFERYDIAVVWNDRPTRKLMLDLEASV